MLKLLSGCLGSLPFLPNSALEENAQAAEVKGLKRARVSEMPVRTEEQGETLLKLTLEQDHADWQSEVVARMTERRPLVLEGFPLTEVARLCLAHHFRWSFLTGPFTNGHTLLLLRPGTVPAPPSEPAGTNAASGD